MSNKLKALHVETARVAAEEKDIKVIDLTERAGDERKQLKGDDYATEILRERKAYNLV